MSAAIYPGSFDPITNGHLSIIESGLVVFERIVVACRFPLGFAAKVNLMKPVCRVLFGYRMGRCLLR